MNLDLAGKRALITGGSKGLGLATACRFAPEGCSLYLVARSQDALAASAETVWRASAVTVKTFAVDLGQRGAARRVIETCGDARLPCSAPT